MSTETGIAILYCGHAIHRSGNTWQVRKPAGQVVRSFGELSQAALFCETMQPAQSPGFPFGPGIKAISLSVVDMTTGEDSSKVDLTGRFLSGGEA